MFPHSSQRPGGEIHAILLALVNQQKAHAEVVPDTQARSRHLHRAKKRSRATRAVLSERAAISLEWETAESMSGDGHASQDIKSEASLSLMSIPRGATQKIMAHYQSSAPPLDLVPQEWDFVEAVEYWRSVIVPQRNQQQLATEVRLQEMDSYSPSPKLRLEVVASAIAYRISSHCRQNGILIRPGEPQSAAPFWSKYHYYIGEFLRSLNNDLTDAATNRKCKPKYNALNKIRDLMICTEIFVLATGWRPHLEGFFTLYRLIGATDRYTKASVRAMLIHAITSGTTSPSTNPIRAPSYFTSTEIRDMYAWRYWPNFPCPTCLFVEINEITQLRTRVANGASKEEVQSTANNISERILAFIPNDWTEKSWEISDEPEIFHMLARVYKATVILYAIVSLPRYALISRPTAGAELAGHEKLKLAYRAQLLELIGTTWGMINAFNKQPLNWPLIVVGFAVADGSQADQMLVSKYLHEIGINPNSAAGPLYAIAKLELFWKSGKTAWDDCFDETMLALAS